MEILEKLFGGAAKVKIIKLFLLNPGGTFDVAQVAERARVSVGLARKEISDLTKIGFLKPHTYIKETKRQRNRSVSILRKRTNGWTLDQRFEYLDVLETFLSAINPFQHKDIIRKLSKAGRIQLLVVSGVFIKYPDARADLLVVGDNLKLGTLDNIIKNIEAEVGKEIRYAAFETSEFNYRASVFDRLIRDVLDYPHQKVINKLGL